MEDEYTVSTSPDNEGDSTTVSESDSLKESIDSLNESITLLNENLATTEEVTTEEITTEEVTTEESELPVTKGDLEQLHIDLDNVSSGIDDLIDNLNVYFQNTYTYRNVTPEDLQVSAKDPEVSVDTHYYLSTEFENADINDIFSLMLSIRNCFILFAIFWFIFMAFRLLRSVVERLMNR